jgi:hypothetical protein
VQRDVLPRKANVTLASTPSGLQVKLDGMPHATPFTFTGVAGIHRTIEAVQPQVFGGTNYIFNSWSDGGAETHTISTPATATTLTAQYSNSSNSPIVSINFRGGGPNGSPTAMAATESAGVLPVTNWNNAAAATGSLSALKTNAGANSGAAVTWGADDIWSTGITETAGNNRMMKGYLNTDNATTTTVRVTGLPAAFTGQAYSVIVYCDGDNGFADRRGVYTIGSQSITMTDVTAVDYAGTFVRATNGGAGNYILFSGLTGNSFTLTATPGLSEDTTPRAPLNGIQIVGNAVAPAGGTFRIHGRIATSGGIAVPNVNVTRSGSATPVVTNSAGYYQFLNLANGTYTITPNLSGYVFNPASRSITVSGADSINNNFVGSTGSSATYRIYGRIATSAGIAIPNVRVTRSGSTAFVTTNSAGYYIFNGVPNGTYTVTPALSGYAFAPSSKTVTVNGADAAAHNFVGSNG